MKHNPKKHFSQNFLKNSAITRKIADCYDIENKIILEIGPGTGMLTGAILSKNPKQLICIEKDRDLIPILVEKFQDFNNIQIFNQDALYVKISDFSNEKVVIFGNLPYNIGTTLVINWLQELDFIESINIMLQKEVVDRICAKPKNGNYGRISILIQAFCNVERKFNIGPENFDPIPKVDSSVVQIIPKEKSIRDQINYQILDQICTLFFCQRRKTINSILKSKKIDFINNLILQNTRAEELSIEDFIEISEDFSRKFQ